MVRSAKYEAVRIFGGKPGNYWTAEASRRYPYMKKGEKGTCSLGRVDNRVIPQMYFSQPIVAPAGGLPMNVTERYDYDARFPLGYGPMAIDKENRIIQTWNAVMQGMADTIWETMKNEKKYSRLCLPGNEFNHCSIHFYRNNARVKAHEDRRRNSMRENTAVVVLTIGDKRELWFHRKYDDNHGQTMAEPNPCYLYSQEEGCLFILDPSDEHHKMRRDQAGRRRKTKKIVHTVSCGSEKNYISIALIFRCLETIALLHFPQVCA